MSDPFFDKFIADLVKGAEVNSRANGGPGVNILISRDSNGREEKLAADFGALLRSPLGGAALGAGVGGLAGLVGDDGHPLRDAVLGAGIGGLHGSLSRGMGNVRNDIAHGFQRSEAIAQPAALEALQQMHARPGADYGTIDKAVNAINTPFKGGALKDRYAHGAGAALGALGIKEAFLPMLGAIAGPMLARAGMGALGRGAAGSAIGGLASKVAPRIAGGIGGAAFDQAASMAGGALGQKVQQPQGQMG